MIALRGRRRRASAQLAQPPAGGSRHPLPWQNRPSNGENHVSDADGRVVYDGPDPAEMFRLYDEEVRSERAAREMGLGRNGSRRRGTDRGGRLRN
jgi:hypothetical protein